MPDTSAICFLFYVLICKAEAECSRVFRQGQFVDWSGGDRLEVVGWEATTRSMMLFPLMSLTTFLTVLKAVCAFPKSQTSWVHGK